MKIGETKDFELIARLSESIQQLHASLYPEFFKEYEYEGMREHFKNMMDVENIRFILIEDPNPVGYAMIEIKSNPETVFKKAYKSLYVHQINIIEPFIGQGYGARLIKHIENIARENDINMIQLDYWASNERAKQFYLKEQFETIREVVIKRLK